MSASVPVRMILSFSIATAWQRFSAASIVITLALVMTVLSLIFSL
jgi:hypothetical protein